MTICICGHYEHAPTEPRVCMVIACKCFEFRVENPYSHFLSQVDVYLAKFTKQEEVMEWVLINLPFFRNYNNFELVINYWKYILHYDMENQFLTPAYKKLLEAKGQPETITRTRRGLVELNEEYAPMPQAQEQKVLKQFGIMEWAVNRK